jgi:hypothetical protein
MAFSPRNLRKPVTFCPIPEDFSQGELGVRAVAAEDRTEEER